MKVKPENDTPNFRPGKFGSHCTDSGKIVYKRIRHYWRPEDINRILPLVAQKQKEDGADFNWFWKIINWLADYMLGEIVGLVGLSDDFARTAWAWIMLHFSKLLQKMFGADNYTNTLVSLFSRRLSLALDKYLAGDETLLKALLKDLAGG